MLKSSDDYLHALRGGKYLLFLEWPRFVVAQYNGDHSADQLIDLLVFEWLSKGYREEDARHMAFLCKLREFSSTIWSADLDYALVSLSIVVLQCMIYKNLDVLPASFVPGDVIKTFIALVSCIDSAVFEASLKEQQEVFSQLMDRITPSQLKNAIIKIAPILKLREAINNYLSALDMIPDNGSDELIMSRIGVVRRLALYVQEQEELTKEVQMEVNTYIAKIWELDPQQLEENYLITILPRSLTNKIWHMVSGLGVLLFDLPAEKLKEQIELPKKREVDQPPSCP